MSNNSNEKPGDSSDSMGLLFLLILAVIIGSALITGIRWAASVFNAAG